MLDSDPAKMASTTAAKWQTKDVRLAGLDVEQDVTTDDHADSLLCHYRSRHAGRFSRMVSLAGRVLLLPSQGLPESGQLE